MRNGGGSTDIKGLSAKKSGPVRSHFELHRPLPVSAAGRSSALRGADVVDAEFVHVTDDGQTFRPAGKTAAPASGSCRHEQVQFEHDRSAGFRRLGLFSGQSLTREQGKTVPIFGLAALVAALGMGGFLFAGGMKIGSVATTAHIPPGAVQQETAPGNVIPAAAVLAQGVPGPDQPSGTTSQPAAGQTSGQRTQGSMIYIRSPERGSGRSVAAPVRGHKDLSISLAGGSGGR